jgi:hypothetical protein
MNGCHLEVAEIVTQKFPSATPFLHSLVLGLHYEGSLLAKYP